MNKCIKIAVLIVIMLIHSIGIIYSQTEQYKFRHLTTKDGLSSHYVNCITKDSRGFMWFGTEDGLNRFDGYNIVEYKHIQHDSTSLSDNAVISILELDPGHLLVGTAWGGLNLFEKTTEKFAYFKNQPGDHNSLSQDRINVIYRDNQGLIWIGTNDGLNLFDPDSGTFEVFKQYPQHELDLSNQIRSIFQDNHGNFWVGTSSGLFRFDLYGKVFSPVEFDPSINFNILYNVHFNPASIKVNSINEDPFGYLWIGTDLGLFKYHYANHGFPRFHHLGLIEDVEMISLNDRHYAWISTHWGLFQYDFQTDEFTSFYSIPGDHESISNQATMELLYDDAGLLWIITSGNGIDMLRLHTSPFQQHLINGHPQDPYTYSACEFFEDKEGNIWVGSHAAGLLKYDQNLKLISKIDLRFSDNTEWEGGRVKKILQDTDGVIWIGMANPKPSISFFNRDNEIFQLITYDTNWSVAWELPVKYINDMIEDHLGNIWLGFHSGLFWIPGAENEDNLMRSVDHNELSGALIIDLFEDRNNHVWVVSYMGLYSVETGIRDSLVFIKYSCSGEDQSVKPRSVYQGANGQIWVGTNQGLYQVNQDTRQFYPVDEEDELLHTSQINAITEDAKGNLWMATSKGLVKFKHTPGKGNYIKLFENVDGLPYEGSVASPLFQTRSGRIFVTSRYGTQNGFYCFHPDSIIVNRNIAPVVVTDFKVRNHPFELDSNIIDINHINLRYNENYFSFEFAALDYINPERNQYAYKLEGIDDDWISSGNRRFASYTAIPPSDYIFRVKGSNSDGYWNEEGASIGITIYPPPWKTWWAYTLYLLFIIFIFYIVMRYYLRRQRLLHDLELEQVQTEKLEELDRLKSRFFANISHEFRTPLMLVLGPLEKLIRKGMDKEIARDLNIMQRNTRRLHRLINQLLDISKIESGKMKLRAAEWNLVPLVGNFIQSFESLAKHKQIDLVFKSEEDVIDIWIDKEKVEQILNNLLSNAFKFTEAGGAITVQVGKQVDGRQLTVDSQKSEHPNTHSSKPKPTVNRQPSTVNCVFISITDTGRGIPPDKLEHIFDRFYQADDSYTREQEGTGIGLALTKELVELHHGQITVESDPHSYREGKGTTFTVFLPLGKEHLKEAEITDKNGISNIEQRISNVEGFNVEVPDTKITEKRLDTDHYPLILIVEDNTDMRSYIREYLDEDYHVIEAGNGEEGLEVALENIPDLIISDVMMPKMDGYHFCREVKKNEQTSHIPIILLTARASTENKLEGLETGADDFITKPFDSQELKVRVKNLIEQRKRWREQFLKKFHKSNFNPFPQLFENSITSVDEKFLQKAYQIVEQRIDDPELSVETFMQDLAMSHMQLYRKLKALLDISANEFIRSVRLNHAARMIERKSGNIAQVSYAVGFNNPSYFAECFKKQFGMTPSEFAKTCDPHH